VRWRRPATKKSFSAQGYLFLGELYADKGQKEKALENLKKAERMFRDMGMDYWVAKTQEVLGRLQEFMCRQNR